MAFTKIDGLNVGFSKFPLKDHWEPMPFLLVVDTQCRQLQPGHSNKMLPGLFSDSLHRLPCSKSLSVVLIPHIFPFLLGLCKTLIALRREVSFVVDVCSIHSATRRIETTAPIAFKLERVLGTRF